LLHFQADESGWSSPQVPPADLVEQLRKKSPLKNFPNQTPSRAHLLSELKCRLPATTLLAAIDQRGGQPITADRPVLLAQVNPVQQMPAQPQQMETQPNIGQGGQLGVSQAFDPEARSRIIGRGRAPSDVQNSTVVENIDNVLNDLRGQGANWFNN